jgi:lipoprotein-releasing system permease protein
VQVRLHTERTVLLGREEERSARADIDGVPSIAAAYRGSWAGRPCHIWVGMYKLQLIRKYLFKRRIAWVALVAVMLCTAMVLVVVSVMGGWLRAFENSFHGMTGDVVISANSLAGFPDYQEMIDGIAKLPDAVAAVPVIRTGALINIGNQEVELVQVLGYPPNIGTVNDWPASLHLTIDKRRAELEKAAAQPGITPEDRQWFLTWARQLPFGLHPDVDYESYRTRRGADPRGRPGIVVSSTVVGLPKQEGPAADRLRDVIYQYPVSLTMVPVKGNEQVSTSTVTPVAFWIVDDSKSKVWQLDNNNVYISFDEAQRDLGMTAAEGEDARCSEIQIKARPGADLDKLCASVFSIADNVRNKHQIPPWYDFRVETWVQQQGAFIQAVKKEVVLTTVLFSVISLVAVLLIFCIFYMIVIEKTKDIGIIKSVGATGWGILTLFMGYGLAIGVVGAAMGFGVAFIIVRYINEIHAWLGRRMGIVIWSPETYQFEKIPSQMEPKTVFYVLLFAILSALVGAMIPAIRAAVMRPVDALRYE